MILNEDAKMSDNDGYKKLFRRLLKLQNDIKKGLVFYKGYVWNGKEFIKYEDLNKRII